MDCMVALQRRSCSVAGDVVPEAVAATSSYLTRDRVLSFARPALDKRKPHTFVTAAAHYMPMRCANGKLFKCLMPDLHFQDPSHLGTKLKSRVLTRDGHGVPINNRRAKIAILRDALSGQGPLAETTLGVRRDDLDAKQDPMDVPTFLRLVGAPVIVYLEELARQEVSQPQPAASTPVPAPAPTPTTPTPTIERVC